MINSPIKTQGRKTKLVEWISKWTDWYGGSNGNKGRWIEPFAGSCQVGLSFAPAGKALMCDMNPYLIELCKDMQSGAVSRESMTKFMEKESKLLQSCGYDYFMSVRKRFNRTHGTHDLLFLNHICFNGLMRWNRSGDFNSSYGRNPTKINKKFINTLCRRIRMFNLNTQKWRFACRDWNKTILSAKDDDFIYMDPPYEGLDSTYFSTWPDGGMSRLCKSALKLPCKWAISSWSRSGERDNPVMESFRDAGCYIIEKRSRYMIGPAKSRRDIIIECLVLPPP